ncbi:MAG: aspartate aminotransferase family protein, partial [Gammaproteobacteria bacterium]|nr:aspartate aminotransferase family protein [Gammaproteobacteria bacterium]
MNAITTGAEPAREARSFAAIEQAHSLPLYPKRGLTIVRGEGASLFDDQGREYIDCTAGVGVANLGHAHPALVDAITRQANTLITCPSIFDNDTRARMLDKLVELAPAGLDRAFLCNSGAEANEAAIKFARHSTGKTGFVSAMRGFHGRTMGALSATHKYRDAFEPLLPGFGFAPFNNLEKLAAAISADTGAVVMELVQGEGGVRPAKAEFVQGVRQLCDDRGLLLIVDEVQTGFGRTGRMFACEHFGLEPDILCLAKSIGGGVPMGAVLVNDKIRAEVGLHGTTFGGNPLA